MDNYDQTGLEQNAAPAEVVEITSAVGAPSVAPQVVPEEPSTIGLYGTASEALQEVTKAFNDWSAKLTDTSLQMCYAVIASDWLVFGSVSGIIENLWAKMSILMVIIALGANVAGAWRLAELHRKQAEQGDKNPKAWQKEFEASLNEPSYWPFTKEIEDTALAMRRTKAICTLAGAVLLIVGAVIKAVM